jgi:hypothetical protein
MVVATATKELFESKHFSICAVRKIAEIVGASRKGPAWDLLDALHCIDYASMPIELRESIPLLVNEILISKKTIINQTCVALEGVEI